LLQQSGTLPNDPAAIVARWVMTARSGVPAQRTSRHAARTVTTSKSCAPVRRPRRHRCRNRADAAGLLWTSSSRCDYEVAEELEELLKKIRSVSTRPPNRTWFDLRTTAYRLTNGARLAGISLARPGTVAHSFRSTAGHNSQGYRSGASPTAGAEDMAHNKDANVDAQAKVCVQSMQCDECITN
jgi:hypothetical protein